MHHTKKFQITHPPTPIVWVSNFPSVSENGIFASDIMKKLKNGCHFVNVRHTGIFPRLPLGNKKVYPSRCLAKQARDLQLGILIPESIK